MNFIFFTDYAANVTNHLREVVVGQLVERLLLIPEVRGWNPVIGKKIFLSNICLLSTVFWKDKIKKKRPRMAHLKNQFQEVMLKISVWSKLKLDYSMVQVIPPCQVTYVINKFYHRVVMQFYNKTLWLDVPSYMTNSICIIAAMWCRYAKLKFVYNIGPRTKIIVWNTNCAFRLSLT